MRPSTRRLRTLAGVIAVAALAFAACSDDGGTADGLSPGDPAPGDEVPYRPDLPPPPEGVAAVVDGRDIPDEDLHDAFEQLTGVPQVAEQLEADEEGALRSILQAQVLTRLITVDIVLRAAADDFGIEPTDEQIEAQRDELLTQLGGEEALERELRAAGLSEEQLRAQELPLMVIVDELPAALGVEADPDGGPAGDAANQAIEEWVVETLAAAEVSVRAEIGTWDPQTGQVVATAGS